MHFPLVPPPILTNHTHPLVTLSLLCEYEALILDFPKPLSSCTCKTFSPFHVTSLSQPHFEGSVRSPFTLPKMGLENPPGLPKTQSSIAGVKTPCLEVFFTPLERSWSVDVQNCLARVIWTFAAQVIAERRAGSQTGSLTPDH